MQNNKRGSHSVKKYVSNETARLPLPDTLSLHKKRTTSTAVAHPPSATTATPLLKTERLPTYQSMHAQARSATRIMAIQLGCCGTLRYFHDAFCPEIFRAVIFAVERVIQIEVKRTDVLPKQSLPGRMLAMWVSEMYGCRLILHKGKNHPTCQKLCFGQE